MHPSNNFFSPSSFRKYHHHHASCIIIIIIIIHKYVGRTLCQPTRRIRLLLSPILRTQQRTPPLQRTSRQTIRTRTLQQTQSQLHWRIPRRPRPPPLGSFCPIRTQDSILGILHCGTAPYGSTGSAIHPSRERSVAVSDVPR